MGGRAAVRHADPVRAARRPAQAVHDTTGAAVVPRRPGGQVASSFTSTSQTHGGQESTVLAPEQHFYHWGSIIVPTGWADPVQYSAATATRTAPAASRGNQAANVHEDNLASVESRPAGWWNRPPPQARRAGR